MDTIDHDLEIEKHYHPENFEKYPPNTKNDEEEKYIKAQVKSLGGLKRNGRYSISEELLLSIFRDIYSNGKLKGFSKALEIIASETK